MTTTTYPTSPPQTLQNLPPPTKHCILSFPTPQILLVTLNRPESLNCINLEGHWELDAVWKWLDDEPSMRVGIITGRGKGFCVGMDLKEWNDRANKPVSQRHLTPSTGFAAISRRTGKKPIIAAVNGLCLGGGMELVTNADLVLATPTAQFAFPEVRRGVVAIAGALPRLVRTIGRQRAMEMVLTGRMVGAREGREWGFVNRIVEGDVVVEAVRLGGEIAKGSPDSVVVSRVGLGMGWEAGGVEEGTRRLIEEGWWGRLEAGENFKEGLRSFVEKRGPRWVDSKL